MVYLRDRCILVGKVIFVDLAIKTSCEFWSKHHIVCFSQVSIYSLVSRKEELLLKWELGATINSSIHTNY